MHIEVCEYDPAWPSQFLDLKAQLEHTLRDTPYVSIEHVGSTSIPSMWAKNILDIDIVVQERQLQAVVDAVTHDGVYEYVDQGIADRHAIRPVARASNSPQRNIYICIEGCQALRNHLKVREICRSDPKVRDAYAEVKRELSHRQWESQNDYCIAKTDVLCWVLNKAGFSDEEVQQIANLQ